MVKTLVLIRHAHRDTSRREIDNGLDDKGREQAKYIRRFFASRFSPEDLKGGLWMVSSPKIRCVETLQPSAKALERSVDIHPALDEGGALDNKVRGFLQEWQKSKVATTLVCSHGDWIPVAIHQLLGLNLDVKKGSWTEIEWDSRFAQLKWYIPGFKHLYS